MNEIKRVNLNEPSFSANGKTYFIEAGLSIERYCQFQIYEKELAFNMSFDEMMRKLKDLYRLLNKQELVASSVLIDSMVRGVSKIQENEPVVLKICALFINEENEDRGAWSDDLVVKKIDDWKKEGLDMRDFFGVALNSVNGLLEIYNKITLAISENTQASALKAIL